MSSAINSRLEVLFFFLVANFAKWARTGATGPVVTWSAVRVARTYSSLESRFMISPISHSSQLLTNIFGFYVIYSSKLTLNNVFVASGTFG